MNRLNSSMTLPRQHARPAASLLTALFITLIIAASSAPAAPSSLPRSTPEKEGVSSRGILTWVEAMEKSGMEFHSLMIVRHGKVIAEGWWKPYAPGLKHTMYSVSKSFSAAAVGYAVTEKRLTVDDTVVSFFPESLPATVSPHLAELTVKDLLTMSVGQEANIVNFPRTTDTDWVKSFLAMPIADKPGTKFLYNSLGSYMLSAIVQKVTGQRVIDYLTPRLFAPLGIRGIDWEIDPMGINTGGWGLRLKTEDMAKFGLLYLQHGLWNGRQVMPKEWIAEATSMKILQSPHMPKEARDTSDWQQGYCYQMWRCRHNGFRADGAFGQLIVMLPDQDAVVVVTAETTDMQAELNLLWKYLLPALESPAPDTRPGGPAALKKKLASLSIAPPAQNTAVGPVPTLAGMTFMMERNPRNIRSLSFASERRGMRVTLSMDSVSYPITFGRNSWISGTTALPGPGLIHAKGDHSFLAPYRINGSYRWKDARTLELTLRYIESPHTETYLCAFNDASVSLTIENSIDKGKQKETIAGRVK